MNTNISSLSPLSNLYNVSSIYIQGNNLLSSCCEIIQFYQANSVGLIDNIHIGNNAFNCSNIDNILLNCQGYISGCTDSTALNYNQSATIENYSCQYNCLDTYNDIVDYTCNGSPNEYLNNGIILDDICSAQNHIDFPNGICYENTPPSCGPHRPMWAKWGEYEFLPPQRYLHNLEHGGVVFLYHPCVSIEIIESLRNLACSIDDDDGGEFRWILSPYPNVLKNIHVLTWQKNYMNDFFDAPSILNFISENYRNAPEDIGYDGLYDSLFIGKCENFGCIDSTAINFDSTAIVDNYSCEYFSSDTQYISLNQGWNIFSSFINPNSNLMSDIFQNYESNIIIIKNNFGNIFSPQYNFDLSMSNSQGYFIKLNNSVIISINGEQIQPEIYPIYLDQGWNIVPYLREAPENVELIFQDMNNNLIIVKDDLGKVYLPYYDFNNLGYMNQGKGYQIKLISTDTLYYLSNDQDY